MGLFSATGSSRGTSVPSGRKDESIPSIGPDGALLPCCPACFRRRRSIPVLDAMKSLWACPSLLLLFGPCLGAADTLWEQYLALPSSENASRVMEIAYSPCAVEASHRYLAADLDILELQVTGGDREAFRLAYRLQQATPPGDLLEELTLILARALRPQPMMFLREMNSLLPESATLRSILMMPGPEYVDRPHAVEHELERRRDALRAVTEPELLALRERCLQLMSE
jgi:hypothetical protein